MPPFHQSSLVNLTVEEERLHCFGRVVTPAFPSEVPTTGTTDQVRPRSTLWHQPRTCRLADLSSQTPSGGGQRADPVQKHDPGGTDDSQVER
jgi:hypothetical protein